MKRTVICIIALLVTLSLVPVAAAVSFTPSRMDLFDLDHYSWYTWRIDWTPAEGEIITGATLIINDIYNWANSEPNDQLNIWLLDDPVVGNLTADIYRGSDNQAVTDFFADYTLAGAKTKIATYTDLDDNASTETLIYDLFSLGFGGTFTSFTANSFFGFGFDPDCHYYNSGITLNVTTQRVPEPSTLMLLGIGLIGLAFMGRRFRFRV